MRPKPKLPAICILLLVPATLAAPDEVVLAGKPPFRDVKVTELRDGELVFRGLSGQYLRKPLRVVERLDIAALPQLSAAESALAAGDVVRAVANYESFIAQSAPGWERDLARLRLLNALDRPTSFDRAVDYFVELTQDRPKLVRGAAPFHPAPAGSLVNAAALRRLAQSVSDGATPAARELHLPLLIALWFYEERPTAPSPATIRELAGQVREAPADEPPLLRPPTPTSAPGDTRYGSAGRADTPYLGVRFENDHFLMAEIRRALEAGDARRSVRLSRRVRPYVAPADLFEVDLLYARGLLAAGEAAEAVERLAALADRAQSYAQRSEVRYHAAIARGQRGEVAGAIRELDALAEDAASPASTREAARVSAARLRGAAAPATSRGVGGP